MSLRLPNSVASSQDVMSLLFEIKEYSKWFSHEIIKVESHIKKVSKSPDLSIGAKLLLEELSEKKSLSKDTLENLIESLSTYCDKAPTISITLASPTNEKTKETLVSWCRKNLAQNTLVNFGFNSSLLGGMVIRCGSHIYDWSFKRQILANKQNFAKVLKNV